MLGLDSRGGAQRLAASPEKSRLKNNYRPGLVGVLNASRHHRKNRAQVAGVKFHDLRVLNASRHHRKNR